MITIRVVSKFFMFSFVITFLILTIASDAVLILPHSSLIETYDSVPDEGLFYYYAKIFSERIASADWQGVSSFGTPYGYGSPFWLFAALLVFIFPNAATHGIAVYKLIFLVIKWASYTALLRVIVAKRGWFGGTVFSSLILSCSALFFYGKVFSPEFAILGLSALSIVLICNDEFCLTWRAYLALSCAIVAAIIKLTAAPTVLSVIFYLFLSIIWNNGERLRHGVRALVVAACTTLVCVVLPAASVAGRQNIALWNAQNLSRTFNLQNGLTWLGYATTTGDMISLSGGIGYLGTLAAVTLFFWGAFTARTKASSFVFVFGVPGLLGFISVIFANGYLDWYLWIPTILLIVSASLVDFPRAASKYIALAIAAVTLLCSISETLHRIDIRRDVLHLQAASEDVRPEVTSFLSSTKLRCNQPIFVASDLLIAGQGAPGVVFMRFRDLFSLSVMGPPTQSFFLIPPSFWEENQPTIVPHLSQVTHIILNTGLMATGLSRFTEISKSTISSDQTIITMDGRTYIRVRSFGGEAIYQISGFCS